MSAEVFSIREGRPPEPWERLPAESVQAFRAFERYRSLGRERSLDRVSADLYPSPLPRNRKIVGKVGEWSSKFRWVERVKAWESHLANAACAAEQRAVETQQEQVASLRQRIRDEAIEDYDLFRRKVRAAVDATGVDTLNSARNIQSLAVAIEKVRSLANDAFRGLEPAAPASDDPADDMDPEMAELVRKIMSEHGKQAREAV